MNINTKAGHRIVYRVEKFRTGEDTPFEVVESTPKAIAINLLLNEGITALANLLVGNAETAYDNTNAYLGVGNDGTAPAAGQTGLQGASKSYQGMNATYPQISGQDVIFQADFGDGVAEFAWNEETVANGNSDSADNLCRQNTALGTKAAGQTWRLTATITFS